MENARKQSKTNRSGAIQEETALRCVCVCVCRWCVPGGMGKEERGGKKVKEASERAGTCTQKQAHIQERGVSAKNGSRGEGHHSATREQRCAHAHETHVRRAPPDVWRFVLVFGVVAIHRKW